MRLVLSHLVCIVVLYLSFLPLSYADHEQIIDYNKKLEKIEHILQSLLTEIQHLKNNINISSLQNNKTSEKDLEEIDAEEIIFQNGVSTQADENNIKTNEELKKEYDIALAKLKKGDLVYAKNIFEQIVNHYENSPHHANAIFWYAESFFRNKEFQQAAKYYLKCYDRYPKGSKAPDALLKLAMSLEKLKEPTKACSILNMLDKQYPERSSTSIRRTKELKNSICINNKM